MKIKSSKPETIFSSAHVVVFLCFKSHSL